MTRLPLDHNLNNIINSFMCDGFKSKARVCHSVLGYVRLVLWRCPADVAMWHQHTWQVIAPDFNPLDVKYFVIVLLWSRQNRVSDLWLLKRMTKTSTSQSRDSDLKISARLIEVGQWLELTLFILFIHFFRWLGCYYNLVGLADDGACNLWYDCPGLCGFNNKKEV